MTSRLNSDIDGLYKLPLDEFTSARNTLARSLSGGEKKQVSSLVKPSLPMWVVNQLYWNNAPTYKALIDASEKLRAAHRSALAGRDVDTRKADQLHKATLEKAFADAVGDARKNGIRLTDPVRDAIRRTLAALPTDEPAGRMTREPPPAGFSLLTGVKPQPIHQQKKAAAVSQPKPSAEALRRQKREERQAERIRQAAERKARQDEEKTRKEREKRDREIRRAEQALRDAERRLAELKRQGH